MRRRPLLRAAAVGGAAYYAGKRGAQHSQAEAGQDQRLNDLEQQQQYAEPAQAPPPAYAPAAAPAYAAQPQPAPAAQAAPSDIATQLEQLAALRQQGALTDEEFSAAKARLLAGSTA
jgi:hypothetical protein